MVAKNVSELCFFNLDLVRNKCFQAGWTIKIYLPWCQPNLCTRWGLQTYVSLLGGR